MAIWQLGPGKNNPQNDYGSTITFTRSNMQTCQFLCTQKAEAK